ncbi:ankyrin repeat domain-containing protein [Devosia sp.]|uniref:ankyrin repeat domain-containing protein n=1 Tax=Devosia sp. TaxID=1871048 RepID=UPI003BAB59A3
MTDLFELVARNDISGLASALTADPSSIAARHASGASLLAWSAYVGNTTALSILRKHWAKLDPYEAIIVGDLPVLTAAVADGWDGNALSPDGFTPLGLAAFFGNEPAFDLLLPLTHDVNQQATNPQKVAALHAATARRSGAMVQKLLKAGANPNLRQVQDVTALHVAAANGDNPIAVMLLASGADPSLKDAAGLDAAAHARAKGHVWLASRLEQA